jgi:hypothetical protein
VRLPRRKTRSGPTCLDTPGNTSPWAFAPLSPHAAGVAWITRGACSAFRDRRRRARGERGPVVTSTSRSPPRRPTAWAEPGNPLRATRPAPGPHCPPRPSGVLPHRPGRPPAARRCWVLHVLNGVNRPDRTCKSCARRCDRPKQPRSNLVTPRECVCLSPFTDERLPLPKCFGVVGPTRATRLGRTRVERIAESPAPMIEGQSSEDDPGPSAGWGVVGGKLR